MVRLDKLVRQVRVLRPLPATTVRLAGLVSSSHVDLEEICEVIAYDQSLTLSLLRAANSAAEGGVSDVSQVFEAVFRLGAARVLALAVSANTCDLLKGGVPAYNLGEGVLWRHSVAAASAAETLSEFVNETLPPESFTAALLHDVGKLVMGRFLKSSDLEMISRTRSEAGLDLLAAETRVLGVHHGELGGIIAQHWKLPESIVKGIIYHHAPAQGKDLICDTVYAANLIAKRVEDPSVSLTFDKEALERLGLSPSNMDELAVTAREHFKGVSARYQVS